MLLFIGMIALTVLLILYSFSEDLSSWRHHLNDKDYEVGDDFQGKR